MVISFNKKATLLVLLVSTNASEAFHINTRFTILTRSSLSSSSSSLHAAVFYPDGDSGEKFDNDTSERPVTEKLSGPDYTASLARLAAGRSPGLKIEDIERVSVHSVQSTQVDIEALVCEHDGCVSLSVPVELPKACMDMHGAGFEDCILENIKELDQVQQQQMDSQPKFASEEDKQAAERLYLELKDRETVVYPEWWIHPETDLELSKTCESLVGILNESDFQNEVRTLASKMVSLEDGVVVGPVAMVAVGPAGLIIRATGFDTETDKFLGFFEVPASFTAPAMNPDQLRDSVLDIVEGA